MGKTVIPFNYSSAYDFTNGLATVSSSDNLYGVINKSSYTVIPFQYNQLGVYSEGLINASNSDGKYGFIDKNNKVIIPFTYDSAMNFSEVLAAVNKGEKWGYIDEAVKLVIPFNAQYSSVDDFSDGLATVYAPVSENEDNYKYGFIDKTGKLIIPMKYSAPFGDESPHGFYKGKAEVMNFKERRFCINTKGKEVSCK